MTLASSTLLQEQSPIQYSQININDSSGSIDVVAGTTQAVSGSSGITNAITLSGANDAILVGMVVTGTNIRTGTLVQSINGTALTLSQPTTGNAGSLTFALTGKTVKVWRYNLYVTSGSLTFNSISGGAVTTVLQGPITQVNQVVPVSFQNVPLMQTLAGDKLNLSGSAVLIAGTLLVSIEPTIYVQAQLPNNGNLANT